MHPNSRNRHVWATGDTRRRQCVKKWVQCEEIKWPRRCWDRRREGREWIEELSGWEKWSKKFMEGGGMRAGEEKEFKRVEEWKEKKQAEERDKKIRYSRFNWCYKLASVGELPQYPRKGGRKKKWRHVERFSFRNELKDARYWKEGKRKLCGKYGWRMVTWVLNTLGRVWKRWRGGKGLAGKDKVNDDDKNNDIRDGGKWGGVDGELRVIAGVSYRCLYLQRGKFLSLDTW